ncbi:MAG: flagellar hook protein FlgE [Firmicutes bacterium]|nr:flagellar hook protein FlgE [Bacillota bacterium]
MQRSLFTAVSGLRNHQVKLDVIGNNIANVNTVAFKASRVRFQDVFSQTLRGASAPLGGRGGTNPAQVGMGMTVSAIDTIHSQGSPQYTGNYTDLAIQGSGYFVVTDGMNIYYTRDGSFSRAANGELVNSATGVKLLGWMADAAGNIDTAGPLGTLNIPLGEDYVAKATENVTIAGNLDAMLAAGDEHVTDVLVYDSQGGVYTLTLTFTKTGTNTWNWDAAMTDASGTDISTSITGGGDIEFNEEGALSTVSGSTLQVSLTGVNDLNITLDFSGLTQLVADPMVGSTAQANYQDGFPAGELEGFVIGKTGVISGIYTNGMVKDLGQIALAVFPNPEGLQKVGGNMYTVSANSGLARVGTPGNEGRGTIETSALEMSNVDLSYEFTEMITTTRAYQANSRVITSSDELLQEVVNLKR